MARHTEKDFILPILIMLYENKVECTTEEIKNEIKKYIALNDDDLQPYPSRNQNEPGYYQIVGNLISHKNPSLLKYITLIVPESEKFKKSQKNLWLLNDDGIKYVSSILNEANKKQELRHMSETVMIDDIDKKIIDYAKEHNLNSRPITDQKLAKTISEINDFACQYAIYTGKNHKMFNAKDGKPYVEVHHLIPMKASKDFFPRNLDRASNLVCLCPNCHAKLHHGELNERKKMLKLLYDKYIAQLNEEEIYISFDELFTKYYN